MRSPDFAVDTFVRALGYPSLILLLQTGVALAQSPGFDPGQPEKRFNALRTDQERGAPRIALPSLAPGSVPPSSANGAKLFVLRGVRATGATVVSPEQIAECYRPYLGKKVSQADLANIAEAITTLYRAAGFHLSRAIVPVQDIQGGRVRIDVIEGSITEISLKGEDAERFVGKLLEPIASERPSKQEVLERQLLTLNDRPGVRVTDTALEEIGTATGKFRLIVSVKTWPIYTAVSIDNLGASSVGPWQAYATAAFNSYLAPGDSLAINLSTVPNDARELAFGRIAYDVPLGTSGASVGASALYSEVRPGDGRREFGDVTKTEGVEIRGSIQPLQSQKSTLTLTGAFALNNVSERNVFGEVYNDKLRIVSATADYRLKDDFGGTNYLTATVRRGLDILGASRADDLVSRVNGSGSFTAANFYFSRYQPLQDAWSLKVAAAAQYASRELLISQQYYLGGASFGRGYGSATISGDNALAGSVELRYDIASTNKFLNRLQLYGFVEGGTAWNVTERFAGGYSLASAGGGVRFFFDNDLRLDLGVGVPLSYRAAENYDRNPRFLFSVANSFRLCPARGAICS